MNMNKETEEKITKLQLYEQNLQNFSLQKRNIQIQMLEIENALKEIETLPTKVYKIVGPVMFHTEKEKIKKDLKEKKDLLGIHIQSLEKQEKSTEEKAKKIQAEVMAELDKNMEKNGRTH